MRTCACLAEYLNWSFWNTKPPNHGERWASPLWKIRQQYGGEFVDRMLAFAFRNILDTPQQAALRDKGMEFDQYFYRHLVAGDSVIDNAAQKLPDITNILKVSGLKIEIER